MSLGRTVLVVDDDPDLGRIVESHLQSTGLRVLLCASAPEALVQLGREEIDAVITDVLMDGMDGLALCQRVVENAPGVPVVVMTASSKLETAIAAIRVGAYDFITKPLNLDTLTISIERALEHRALRTEVATLRRAIEGTQRFDDLVGGSEPMRHLYGLLEQFAQSDASLLITGESGTGKEVVARVVHSRSRRRAGPLVTVNCAAMAEGLLESELFGHERGAFTDARSARRGLFVQADRGTLFLDEIGELPSALQAKLLRALEERRVRPVGSDREVAFDARVIVATNRDLAAAIEERRFREDLFYRINVLQVHLPPLRSRGRDALILAQHFVTRFAIEAGKRIVGFTQDVAARLLAYHWPGNVRELRNCIERCVALSSGPELTIADLPDNIREFRARQFVVPSEEPESLLPMEEVERQYVVRVLEVLGGNKRQAARALGFDRRTLYRKLEKWGIDTNE